MSDISAPNRHLKTTLIPIEETVSWKVHNVSHIRKTNSWTALSIPLEIGLGAMELSRWNISLVRNKDSILCARAVLLSPKERHRNVTHHLKIAMMSEDGPVYYLPNRTNNNINRNRRSRNNNTTTTARSGNDNDDETTTRCTLFQAIRNVLTGRYSSFHGATEDDPDFAEAKETSHDGEPTFWKIAHTTRFSPDEEDKLELLVTMTVYGCDVSEER